jgi:ABC-type multidrug transport system fused ATPase/permease subunit
VNEFSDPRAVYVFTAAVPSDELPPLRCSGDYVLQEFGFRRARFHANVAALVGMCVVTLTLTYVGLAASDTGVWYRLQQRVAMLRSLRRRKHLSCHCTSSLPGTGDHVNGRGTTSTAAVLEPLLPAATRSGDLDLDSRVSIPEEQIPTTTASPVAPDVEAAAPSFAACTAQCTTVLAWHNVTYTVRDWRGKTKSILRDVSGLAGSGINTGAEREEGVARGALCAVLGPSGAGKSSLLDILSGRVSLSDRRGGVISSGVITAAGRQITGAQLQVRAASLAVYRVYTCLVPPHIPCTRHSMSTVLCEGLWCRFSASSLGQCPPPCRQFSALPHPRSLSFAWR